MPTHLIIDGYNLLGALGQVGADQGSRADSGREQLIRDLAAYRQRKAHAITVVFDGWQHGIGTEHHEHRAGVQVIYSRRGERADQVIQRLVRDFGSACAVVSSDHEIVNYARNQGALVIAATEFVSRLDHARTAYSISTFGGKKLDDDPLPSRPPTKKGNPRKLPKSLRKRNRHLRQF